MAARQPKGDPDALDRTICDLEAKLDKAYARRAHRENCYGWRYCECGRKNQSGGEPKCKTCTDRVVLAADAAMVHAHAVGSHESPLRECLSCWSIGYALSRWLEVS